MKEEGGRKKGKAAIFSFGGAVDDLSNMTVT